MMTILSLIDHVVLIAAEAVMSVQGLLDVLVQFVHAPCRAVPERRIGVAHQLLALGGQLQLLLLLLEIEMLVRLHLLGELVGPHEDDLFFFAWPAASASR